MATFETVQATFQQHWRNFQVAALTRFLPDAVVETFLRELGRVWRNRLLAPVIMVWSMVYRALHPDKAIRTVVADFAAQGLLRRRSSRSWTDGPA
jgi:hypothetical protein